MYDTKTYRSRFLSVHLRLEVFIKASRKYFLSLAWRQDEQVPAWIYLWTCLPLDLDLPLDLSFFGTCLSLDLSFFGLVFLWAWIYLWTCSIRGYTFGPVFLWDTLRSWTSWYPEILIPWDLETLRSDTLRSWDPYILIPWDLIPQHLDTLRSWDPYILIPWDLDTLRSTTLRSWYLEILLFGLIFLWNTSLNSLTWPLRVFITIKFLSIIFIIDWLHRASPPYIMKHIYLIGN